MSAEKNDKKYEFLAVLVKNLFFVENLSFCCVGISRCWHFMIIKFFKSVHKNINILWIRNAENKKKISVESAWHW